MPNGTLSCENPKSFRRSIDLNSHRKKATTSKLNSKRADGYCSQRCEGPLEETRLRTRQFQRQHIEFVRYGEYDMKVAGGEKLALASQCSRACVWLFGQCRFLQELQEIAW